MTKYQIPTIQKEEEFPAYLDLATRSDAPYTVLAQSQPKSIDDLSVVEANYIARQLVGMMPRNKPFRIHSR
jgi:hypothetical protein